MAEIELSYQGKTYCFNTAHVVALEWQEKEEFTRTANDEVSVNYPVYLDVETTTSTKNFKFSNKTDFEAAVNLFKTAFNEKTTKAKTTRTKKEK